MNRSIVVIGSGIAGLATAIRLQQAGNLVHVYEANDYYGGKISEFIMGDFRFDAGPSLFTMPQFIEELFDLCEVPMEQYFAYEKKEIICKYYYEDGTRFTAYADKENYIKKAALTFNEEENSIRAYLASSKKKYDVTKNLFLNKSLHKAKTYLSLDTLKGIVAMPTLGIHRNLNQENEKFFKNPLLVQLFNRYATYNGSSPFLTPGIMSLIPHLENHYGTFVPKGGMISITNSLVSLAEKLGVQLHLNSKVNRILIDDSNKAEGVIVENKKIFSDIVVSNMDVVPTYRKLLKGYPAPEKVLRQERSSSALIFYWGINRNFEELDLHNIFFANNYDREFKNIFDKQTIGDDVTVYLNITAKDIPEDAPSGCENWFVMVNAPGNMDQDWDEIIKRTRANIIKKLSNQLGEEIGPLIVSESILDPRSIESRTQSYQGSLYGAASNNQFAAFLRHPNFSSRFENLYFCGGSVHPGGGIPLCLLSAKITSELILYDK
ncbi:1-hydroxycarotenoid 3,4-desaturase CrtD [Portibacter lacus]|uniref:NAD(P)/FAD-dependent oxidoreductase n=1 Tax=Portibacter lacus TaxID=1099794 RepID=A0AA37SS65_9BACT|nr:1-hydroxycarotenoid 3,4-desaturase CrtD [Portibacter lacus]GLR17856.1 NAD(P)/FAD-dependent oxidoreductase [Portibacter lacus]